MLVGAPLLWSLHIVGSRYALTNGFLPLPFLVLRFTAAAIAFALVTLALERTLRVDGRSDRVLLCVATGLFTANQIAFVYGLRFTSAVTIALVLGLIPTLVSIFSAAVGMERLTGRIVLASAVSSVGVALVVVGIPGGVSKLSGGPGSILVALAIPVTYAIFMVAITPPMRRSTPYRINALLLLGTAVTLLVVGGPTLGDQDLGDPDALSWLSVAFSVVGALLLANVLWFTAIERVGPSRASFFSNLQPFAAALLATVLLDEPITLVQIAGGAAIAAGILVSRRRETPVAVIE